MDSPGRQLFALGASVPLYYCTVQDMEEQKRTKYKINGKATTATVLVRALNTRMYV